MNTCEVCQNGHCPLLRKVEQSACPPTIVSALHSLSASQISEQAHIKDSLKVPEGFFSRCQKKAVILNLLEPSPETDSQR